MSSSVPQPQAERPPLLRPVEGRWVAGVCAGLAAHLKVPVVAVRVLTVLLFLAGGAGVAVYVFWWITVPAGDPREASAAQVPPVFARLAPRLKRPSAIAGVQRRDVVVGLVLIVAAVALVAVRQGWNWQSSWLLPALLGAAGLALAWSQLDGLQRLGDGSSRTTGAGGSVSAEDWRGPGLVRVIGGAVLLTAGILVFIGQDNPGWAVFQAGAAAFAVLAGFALVLAPWWLRFVRALGDERAARARESERADIAAHLHDSVLQTLALIQANAADSTAVARMARAQERELREWLYSDRHAPGTSLAAELKALVAEVEDGGAGHAKRALAHAPAQPARIDVVVVGDCVPDETTSALMQATREALVNAVAHGAPPVSVYMEVTDAAVEVFVRDRGDGFDMGSIPEDRLGVRESILGRVERRGGSAQIVTRPGWGTEVRLKAPRAVEH